MRILVRFTVALALTLMLAACTTTSTFSNEQAINNALDRLNLDRGANVNRLSSFRITSWNAVNNRNLIVTSGLHNHFLLTLTTPCPDLAFAFGIAFQIRGVGLSPGDYIIINSLHQPLDRCQIDQIITLMDRDQ